MEAKPKPGVPPERATRDSQSSITVPEKALPKTPALKPGREIPEPAPDSPKSAPAVQRPATRVVKKPAAVVNTSPIGGGLLPYFFQSQCFGLCANFQSFVKLFLIDQIAGHLKQAIHYFYMCGIGGLGKKKKRAT